MNYKLTISYNGNQYHGWAVQPNHRTVCGEVQNAILKLFKLNCPINASGRTDAGVHAVEQVINIKHKDLHIKSNELMQAINSQLPYDIRIKSCQIVDDKFHARYFAKSKLYKYVIDTSPSFNPIFSGHFYQYNKPFDLNKINLIKDKFIGQKNFLSFSTTDFNPDDCVRTIYDLNIKRNGNFIIISILGDGFLRSMVRMIVGCFLAYNENLITQAQIEQCFENPIKGSIKYKAPSCGLYLYKVYYDEN